MLFNGRNYAIKFIESYGPKEKKKPEEEQNMEKDLKY